MVDSFRSVIEVLKWTEPKTILSAGATASVLWAKVSTVEELWREHIAAEDLEVQHATKAAYKEAVLTNSIKDRLVLAHSGGLRVFHCKTRTVLSHLPAPPNVFQYFSAAALVSRTVLFVCGGNDTSCTYEINLISGRATRLSDMHVSRQFHSALCYRQRVYVFGGESVSSQRSAECYENTQWLRLPEMLQKHVGFNACRAQALIYLCGGGSPYTEVFHTDTQQYSALSFALPESDWTVAFVHRGQLVALIDRTMYVLEERGWRAVSVKTRYVPLGTSAAVVSGDFVYIPMSSIMKIFELDMKTARYREVQ